MSVSGFRYVSVIVTFNRSKLLAKALDALFHQSILPQKVILVNNGSTDDTVSMVRSRFKDFADLIDLYNLSDNKGGSYGFYYGMKQATKYQNADWVSVSDDDAIFQPKFFEDISQVASKHRDIKCFSGSVILPNNKIDILHRMRVNSYWSMRIRPVPLDEYSSNFTYDLFSFVGTVMSLDLVRKIGLPMKDFFIWFDDYEYALRARQYSKVINVSKAHILHLTKNYEQNGKNLYSPDWREYYGIRNEIYYHFKYCKSKPVMWLWTMAHLIRITIGTFTLPKYKGYRLFELKLRWAAVKSGLHRQLGVNPKYLP